VRRVDVDVCVRRDARVVEDLLQRRRRLRALLRVLEKDRVADEEVRPTYTIGLGGCVSGAAGQTEEP
jgi:hypothetical protein